jgi:hypothetical protein
VTGTAPATPRLLVAFCLQASSHSEFVGAHASLCAYVSFQTTPDRTGRSRAGSSRAAADADLAALHDGLNAVPDTAVALAVVAVATPSGAATTTTVFVRGFSHLT